YTSSIPWRLSLTYPEASLYRFGPQTQVGLSSQSSLASNIADWYSTGNVAVEKGRRRGTMLATCGLREPSQFRSPVPYCYTQPTLPLLPSIANGLMCYMACKKPRDP